MFLCSSLVCEDGKAWSCQNTTLSLILASRNAELIQTGSFTVPYLYQDFKKLDGRTFSTSCSWSQTSHLLSITSRVFVFDNKSVLLSLKSPNLGCYSVVHLYFRTRDVHWRTAWFRFWMEKAAGLKRGVKKAHNRDGGMSQYLSPTYIWCSFWILHLSR